MGVSFIDEQLKKEIKIDSISVSGEGISTKLYDNAKNISRIYLPLKMTSGETIFQILINETPCELKIDHANIPYLLSQECGTVIYHQIHDAVLTGNIENKIEFVEKRVQNKRNEIHLYIYL